MNSPDETLLIYVLEDSDFEKFWWPQLEKFAAAVAPTPVSVLWQRSPEAFLIAKGDSRELKVGEEVFVCPERGNFIAKVEPGTDCWRDAPHPQEGAWDGGKFFALLLDIKMGDGTTPTLLPDGNQRQDDDAPQVDARFLGEDYKLAVRACRPELSRRIENISSYPLRHLDGSLGKSVKAANLTANSAPALRWLLERYDEFRPCAAGKVVVWNCTDAWSNADILAMFPAGLAFVEGVLMRRPLAALAGARALVILAEAITKGDAEVIWRLHSDHAFPIFVLSDRFERNLRDRAAGALIRDIVLPPESGARALLLREVLERCLALPAIPTPLASGRFFRAALTAARDDRHVILEGRDAAFWWPFIAKMDFASDGRPLTWTEFGQSWSSYRVSTSPPSRERESHHSGSSATSAPRLVSDLSKALGTDGSRIELQIDIEVTRRKNSSSTRGSSNLTFLILGESGVGKQILANAIWKRLEAKLGVGKISYVTVNCGALPEMLLESELFGHEKGAFTNALKQKKGLFETANGGILLLDEIGDMPYALQVKLLRAIEDRKIRRVGGTQEIDVADLVIIAATNRDLELDVAEGRFRFDLYQRLGAPIQIAPLRERPEELDAVLQNFVKGKTDLGLRAHQALRGYSYPGNFRELTVVTRSAEMEAQAEFAASDVEEGRPVIHIEHLPPAVRKDWVLRWIGRGERPHANVLFFGDRVSLESSRAFEELIVGAVSGIRMIVIGSGLGDVHSSPLPARRISFPEYSRWTPTDRLSFAEFVLRGAVISAADAPRLEAGERHCRLAADAVELIERGSDWWRSAEDLKDDLIDAAIEMTGRASTQEDFLRISGQTLAAAVHRRHISDRNDPPEKKERNTLFVGALEALSNESNYETISGVMEEIDRRDYLTVAANENLPIIDALAKKVGTSAEIARAAILALASENLLRKGHAIIDTLVKVLPGVSKDDAKNLKKNFLVNNDQLRAEKITKACRRYREAQVAT
jgi:hypothetical protein